MRKIDTIIDAKWLLPIRPKYTTLHNHSLAIESGHIIDILPTAELHRLYTANEHIVYDQHVVLPGLINAHTHTPMNLFRGFADDLPLEKWLNEHIWPTEAAIIDAHSTRVGTTLAIAEMLRGGITCFNDQYLFCEVSAQAAQDSGIRACIGIAIMNVNNQWATDDRDCLRKARRILAQPHSSRIQWTLAPHAPYTVSQAALEEIYTLSTEYSLKIHMHVQETAHEVLSFFQQHSMSPMAYLHKLNLLSEQFIAVHCCHLSTEDIELLAKTNTHVVHCPESNLKLASGYAPIPQLLDANVNVCLGTDGAASNNDLDMFSEMRTAALIAKHQSQDPTTLNAQQVLTMATYNGAKALGLESTIGSLEPGKSADIIAVDLGEYYSQPVYDPSSHLVYSTNRDQVTDTWVAGQRLLHNKELTTVDPHALLQQLQPLQEKIHALKTRKTTLAVN